MSNLKVLIQQCIDEAKADNNEMNRNDLFALSILLSLLFIYDVDPPVSELAEQSARLRRIYGQILGIYNPNQSTK